MLQEAVQMCWYAAWLCIPSALAPSHVVTTLGPLRSPPHPCRSGWSPWRSRMSQSAWATCRPSTRPASAAAPSPPPDTPPTTSSPWRSTRTCPQSTGSAAGWRCCANSALRASNQFELLLKFIYLCQGFWLRSVYHRAEKLLAERFYVAAYKWKMYTFIRLCLSLSGQTVRSSSSGKAVLMFELRECTLKQAVSSKSSIGLPRNRLFPV